MKLHEHVRFLFVDRHSYMGAMWWYSEKQWQALPADLKPIVAEGFRVLALATREAAASRQAPAFEAFRRLRWHGRRDHPGAARGSSATRRAGCATGMRSATGPSGWNVSMRRWPPVSRTTEGIG